MSLTGVLVAVAGGIFGTAIGALPAFIFVGLLVIVGVAVQAAGGGGDFLSLIPLGALFGPHVGGWAAGVAGAAYAAKKGKLESGRDTSTALMGLNSPDVLLIGGLFGIVGYVLNWLLSQVGFAWTDTVALSVVLSAIIARLAFGKTGVFGKVAEGTKRFAPDDATKWVPWMSDPAQRIIIGLGAGLMSAYMALAIGPDNGGVVLGFGISAASLVFLQYGTKVPVTHHITLVAAVAAAGSGSLIWGAAFGILAALVGEYMACLFNIHGDTHIDPPAATIAALTSLSLAVQALGIYTLITLP